MERRERELENRDLWSEKETVKFKISEMKQLWIVSGGRLEVKGTGNIGHEGIESSVQAMMSSWRFMLNRRTDRNSVKNYE